MFERDFHDSILFEDFYTATEFLFSPILMSLSHSFQASKILLLRFLYAIQLISVIDKKRQSGGLSI